MVPTFLIGGGWDERAFPLTYGRFLAAATHDGVQRIMIAVAEEPDVDQHERFVQTRGLFESVGADAEGFAPLLVSASRPPSMQALADYKPTGIFVCGGLTPAYQEALCSDSTLRDYLHSTRTPYGGFSAGAAIAAEHAVVGGWRRAVDGGSIVVAGEQTSEDRELIDVRPGLGLVPFAVDVHASQWGTLTRLLHAIDQGSVREGWAIDEDTLLVSNADGLHVYGLGSAYHARRGEDGALALRIVRV